MCILSREMRNSFYDPNCCFLIWPLIFWSGSWRERRLGCHSLRPFNKQQNTVEFLDDSKTVAIKLFLNHHPTIIAIPRWWIYLRGSMCLFGVLWCASELKRRNLNCLTLNSVSRVCDCVLSFLIIIASVRDERDHGLVVFTPTLSKSSQQRHRHRQ